MKRVILYRSELREYHFGENHIFQGNRFKLFLDFFRKKIPRDSFKILKAPPATKEDLLLICERDYIEFNEKFYKVPFLEKENPLFFHYHSRDNFPSPGSGEIEKAARIIVGQAKKAADLVFKENVKKVVSLGGGLHHSQRNFGEGFCIYNDVAFLTLYLLKNFYLKKILILDTDAHFGNGTYEYFKEDPRVLFIDIHQDPSTIYPGSGFLEQRGEGPGKGLKINIPLPRQAGDQCYSFVFKEVIFPVVEEFKPEIIIRNGGSDPHFKDLLTDLGMSVEGFFQLGTFTRELSFLCQEREIDLLASGYHLGVLPYCWTNLISGLWGLSFKLKIKEEKLKEPLSETEKIIEKIKKVFRPYWKCFRK
ncbi:MAG: histone deacetylase [Minisyncoccales bacterium]